MKIAILTFSSFLPPENMGGTEVGAFNIAKYLSLMGHQVHVVTCGLKSRPEITSQNGFFVHRLSYPKIPSLGILWFWMKLTFYIKKINPDFLQGQSVQMGPPCFLAKIFFKKPYFIWGQGSDIYLKWKFKKTISRAVLGCADGIFALADDMKKKIKEDYKKDAFVIPFGINLEDFQGYTRQNAKKKLKINQDDKVVIFIGRFGPEKGIKYLIEAFDIARSRVGMLKLVLIGGGSEEKEIKLLVNQKGMEKCVRFEGYILNEKVPEYLAASDVFVLPSLSEGFGIVNIEAMASGLPIIATNIGGIPDLIKDEENGFLVDIKNPEQIAEKIVFLFSNKNTAEYFSKVNIIKAQKYSWNIIVKNLVEVYKLCLKDKWKTI